MEYKNLKKLNMPDKPGVYFFLGPKKEIFYIGKATSLKSRTRSYFNHDLYQTRGPMTLEMIARARSVKWEATGSVLEALILEANLIKKYQPYYNIKEKDDKSFNYVVITKEELPKVIVVRGRVLEKYKGSIFGPYTSGRELREALKIIRRIFPFLDEKSKNYLEFYRQIDLAPDLNDTKLYKQNIRNIKLFFAGKKKHILRNLKKEMKAYAKAREFEKAGEIKRQIFALQHINDVALLKYLYPASPYVGGGAKGGGGRIEAYDVAHMSGKNMVGVMTVIEGGEPAKNEYRKFSARGGSAFGGKTALGDSKANDTKALAEILERRFAHPEWPYPDLIVVDGSTAQINAAKKVLAANGKDTPIVSVVKDERHRPKNILGDKLLGRKYEAEILLANSEAHRFAIAYHKNLRGKSFLK